MTAGIGKIQDQIGLASWTRPHNFARGAQQQAPMQPVTHIAANGAQQIAAPQNLQEPAPAAAPLEAAQQTQQAQQAPSANAQKSACPVRGKIGCDSLPQNVISLTFDDMVDIINPLQHIPVVSDIYRNVTGDKIGGFARVAGGFLFGGITGGIASFASATYAEVNGRDPGETVIAMLAGDDQPAGATMLAEAGAPQTVAQNAAFQGAMPIDAAAAQAAKAEPVLLANLENTSKTTTFIDKLPANAALAKIDPQTLGQFMHDTAAQATTGKKNPLPPELVRDMMQMAIDKYQATGNLPQ